MSKYMTSRERVLATVQGRIPDCVPHFEWSVDPVIVKTLTNGGSYEDLVDLLDIDAITTGPDYIMNNIGDKLWLDEWGVTRTKGEMDYKFPLDEYAPIQGWEDYEKWSPPDPFTSGRLRTLNRYIERFGGKRAIFIYVRDVWSNPRDLMGYQNLCLATLEQPDLVASIIDVCIDHSIKIAEQAVEMGAEFVITADDIAHNQTTIISPQTWEDLFLPYFRKLVDAFHKLGLHYWKHSDGNIMPVLNTFVDAGIDGIDPIDPVSGMDLSEIKKQYGNRLAIKGNVDCSTVLVSGPKESVIEAVKKCIRIAGPGGGYVCSSSNSIHSGVRPDLYLAMVEAIHTYGKYPLDLDMLMSGLKN